MRHNRYVCVSVCVYLFSRRCDGFFSLLCWSVVPLFQCDSVDEPAQATGEYITSCDAREMSLIVSVFMCVCVCARVCG